MSKQVSAAVAAVLAALVIWGCGSSDESTTASSGNTPGESSGNSSENAAGDSSGSSSGGDSGDSSGGPSGDSSESFAGGNPGGSSNGSSGSRPGKPSGGGNATGEAGTPSGGAFISQVNTVCAEAKRQFEIEAGAYLERTEKNPPKPTEAKPEIIVIETIFVPSYQTQIDRLSSLDIPSGDAEWFDGFLGALQQVIDEVSDDPQSLIDSEGSFGEAAKLARAHDVGGCTDI